MKYLSSFILLIVLGLIILKTNLMVTTDVNNADVSSAVSTHELIDISQVDKSIVIDLRYATSDNFLKHKLYSDNTARLLPHVAHALAKAQQEFLAHGVSIKVWDAYRPIRIQEIMWNKLPDERYVSNPAKGGRHTRGTAVDITLVDVVTGQELKMPTEFDNFTALAHRGINYNDPEVRNNFSLLDSIMTKHGFIGLRTEWWHYDFHDWEKFPVIRNNSNS